MKQLDLNPFYQPFLTLSVVKEQGQLGFVLFFSSFFS